MKFDYVLLSFHSAIARLQWKHIIFSFISTLSPNQLFYPWATTSIKHLQICFSVGLL